VLILDECTAALDRETADKMLDAINTHSKEAKVLSIAHRLRFVLKSDRILVLANGELVALDTVDNLLKTEDAISLPTSVWNNRMGTKHTA